MNRGILDTLGAAVPYISLARNPQERREKIVDRSIIIGSAFVLAPLHAWFFMRAMAKTLRIQPELMRVSFSHLKNTETLKQGLASLRREIPKLRKKVLVPRGMPLSNNPFHNLFDTVALRGNAKRRSGRRRIIFFKA